MKLINVLNLNGDESTWIMDGDDIFFVYEGNRQRAEFTITPNMIKPFDPSKDKSVYTDNNIEYVKAQIYKDLLDD